MVYGCVLYVYACVGVCDLISRRFLMHLNAVLMFGVNFEKVDKSTIFGKKFSGQLFTKRPPNSPLLNK